MNDFIHKVDSQFYHEFFAWFNQSNPVSYGNLQGEIIKNEMFSPEQLEKNLLIGSATEVIEQLQQYNDQGVSEFALWLANGMSYQDNYQCLKKLAKKYYLILNDDYDKLAIYAIMN
ncbi:hypothetical protein NFHSH190041_16630 [Shewanella sp. NFH-SH190041]|uniref:hypothetical protein n=1 Tax=Shewanella sp. NFH-SH190041 TaxID=2950245 RepID=UPI0021C3D63A|nr:hypothetical protein [Shewanella sp. NFH-SH190041]BDM64211.1 hypothetical protein NFHSH190041_16630 [Shewanella sp. NFH-SH190041]